MPASRLVKGLVLTSSCLLVGGYLLYAGAATLMSGSKSARVFPEDTPTTQPTEPRTMISGSKSGRIVQQHEQDSLILYADGAIPPATEPATQPATHPATGPTTRRLIMGGSKSKQVFDADNVKSLTPSATQPAREILPGPKSAPVFQQQRK